MLAPSQTASMSPLQHLQTSKDLIQSPLADLRVVPNPVAAGEPAFGYLTSNGCSTVRLDEMVTVDGNTVTLTHIVERACFLPTPSYDVRYDLGHMAPGEYTLVYAPTSMIPGNEYETQMAHFSVVAQSIPVVSLALGLTLAVAVILIAAHRLIGASTD